MKKITEREENNASKISNEEEDIIKRPPSSLNLTHSLEDESSLNM